MSKLKDHLTEAKITEVEQQAVLDAINVALTKATDIQVRLRSGRKQGKAFMGKQMIEADKIVETLKRKLIDMSDFVVKKMVG
jgi:hypothetical protein